MFGLQVGTPDAIFAFPGQPVVTCGVLEQTGEAGLIGADTCVQLPAVIGAVCECQLIETGAPSV